ncbi:MAG: SUMF1/EgtB/PvdO family nonheme iron enzyme [Fibrobacterota bacterium]
MNSRRKKTIAAAVLIIILALLLFFFLRKDENKQPSEEPVKEIVSPDSVSDHDSLNTGKSDKDADNKSEASSLETEKHQNARKLSRDKTEKPKKKEKGPVTGSSVKDDKKEPEKAGDLNPAGVMKDSIPEKSENKVLEDTIPPYVAPDKGGGIYYDPVSVQLESSEGNSTIYYSTNNPSNLKEYKGPVRIDNGETTIYYSAVDSAGNRSELDSITYSIRKDYRGKCPPEMAYVETDEGGFCMDRYEWPNKADSLPESFVSLYQAMDSCRSIGKRLCKGEEWSYACSGGGDNKYPYGDTYSSRKCNTSAGGISAAGDYHECRSRFGIYDLSGNLREWTSSRSPENKRFYKVYGGYYNASSKSSCTFSQYSFYPANSDITVGFRCCLTP